MGLLEAKKRLQEEQRVLHGCNEHQYFNKRSMKCYKRPVRVDRGLPRKSKVAQNPGFLSELCPSPLFKNRQTHRCVKSLPKKYLDAGLLQAEDCPEGFTYKSEKKRCYKSTRRVVARRIPDNISVGSKSLSPKRFSPKSPLPDKETLKMKNNARVEKIKEIFDWYADPRNSMKDLPEDYSFESKKTEDGIVKYNVHHGITLLPEEAVALEALLSKRQSFQQEYKILTHLVKIGRLEMDDPRALYNKKVKEYLTGELADF
jgi:hypothetical protein